MANEIEAAADAPVPAPPPAAAAPPPEAPRAAAVVIEGKTQAEIDLETRLAEKDKTIKDRELSLAQALDENRQLKEVRAPQPARKKKGCIEAFLAGED